MSDSDRTKRIRELNDAFRKDPTRFGRAVVTRGVNDTRPRIRVARNASGRVLRRFHRGQRPLRRRSINSKQAIVDGGKAAMFPIAKSLGAISLGFALTVSTAQAYRGEKLAKDAKVSIAEAGVVALKSRPGQITDEELKRRWWEQSCYSFDIKKGTTTYEVGIDAQTGAVLENAPEGKNPD